MTGTRRLTSPADRVSVALVLMEPQTGPSVPNQYPRLSEVPSWGSTATSEDQQNQRRRE